MTLLYETLLNKNKKKISNLNLNRVEKLLLNRKILTALINNYYLKKINRVKNYY